MAKLNYWAKKFDEVNHIVDKDSKQVGGGVMCGKYGALLGNNYAHDSMPTCPECLKALTERSKK